MPCQICGNNYGNVEYKVREMMFGFRDVFCYTQCSVCGCLQINLIPSDMSKYYPPNYYSYRAASYPKKKWIRRIACFYYQHLLKNGFPFLWPLDEITPGPPQVFKALSRVNIDKQSRILDVGCGGGEVLWLLKEFGYKNVLGVDPYLDKDIVYPNGLNIRKCGVDQVTGRWDIVMFNHSFEHMDKPLETLEQIFDRLAENGICIIRIPVVDSYAWIRYKECWADLDAPRHFFLHTKASMDCLAKQTGLHVAKVKYDSVGFQFHGSEAYKKDVSLQESNQCYSKGVMIIRRFFFSVWAVWLNRIHRGDCAVFYLSKKGVR
jgi:SAM-dependent methyltransferase